MTSPASQTLTFNVNVRSIGVSNSREDASFTITMPKGSCIAKLDDEVKNTLKGKLDGRGDSLVVEYMVCPHKGKPYKVQRDGKQCVSDIFSIIHTTNKLNVKAYVSNAAPGQGGSNKMFARKASRRRATTADANINSAIMNDIDKYEKGKRKRDAKKAAKKAKKRQSNQPAEKRPQFKGLGRKLCDSTPPENSSNEDDLGEELSDVKDADGLDADILNPDSYNPFDSAISNYTDTLDRGEHHAVCLGGKMGRNFVARDGVGFIDGLPSSEAMKKIVAENVRIRQTDNMNTGALAQVLHGRYEIIRLTNQEAGEKHGKGRVLSGGDGGDPSKFIQIIWSPVVGSAKDAVAENRCGNSHSQVLQIMDDDELEKAMDDLIAAAKDHVDQYNMMVIFRPDILLNCVPHMFWNIVYRAQPKVKPNEARMEFHEMLHKVKPEEDWEFLSTSKRVTRASG